MIFDLLTSTQGHQFDPRIKILLAFCSACHPRRFDMPHDHVWKKIVWPPWAPPALQSPNHGAWPRRQNKNPVWYVLYLSFVRIHTKFGIKIFEIDFVIEINDIWPFDPSLGPQGAGPKKVWLHAPFMWVTHTPNFRVSTLSLKRNSLTFHWLFLDQISVFPDHCTRFSSSSSCHAHILLVTSIKQNLKKCMSRHMWFPTMWHFEKCRLRRACAASF